MNKLSNELLNSHYKMLCETPSDINEHLPILEKLSKECKHITEMGVRGMVSTFAFIIANPERLVCIDIHHPKNWNGNDNLILIEEYSRDNNINFSFIQESSLNIKIEETDMLFIDTLHTYNQLQLELKKHSNKVKKYIILHDTVTYGYEDDISDYQIIEHPPNVPGKAGLNTAILEFLETNKNWLVHEIKKNNNGLTILKRVYNNENL